MTEKFDSNNNKYTLGIYMLHSVLIIAIIHMLIGELYIKALSECEEYAEVLNSFKKKEIK